MSIKYIVMAVFIFVIFHVSLIPLGNEVFDVTAREHLNRLAFFGIPREETTIGFIEYVKAPFNYFSSLYWLFTTGFHDNPLFSEENQLIGYLVFGPIVAGWMFGLIIAFWGIWRRQI